MSDELEPWQLRHLAALADISVEMISPSGFNFKRGMRTLSLLNGAAVGAIVSYFKSGGQLRRTPFVLVIASTDEERSKVQVAMVEERIRDLVMTLELPTHIYDGIKVVGQW